MCHQQIKAGAQESTQAWGHRGLFCMAKPNFYGEVIKSGGQGPLAPPPFLDVNNGKTNTVLIFSYTKLIMSYIVKIVAPFFHSPNLLSRSWPCGLLNNCLNSTIPNQVLVM